RSITTGLWVRDQDGRPTQRINASRHRARCRREAPAADPRLRLTFGPMGAPVAFEPGHGGVTRMGISASRARLSLVACATLLLAACGGDDDSSTAANDTSKPPINQSEPPASSGGAPGGA